MPVERLLTVIRPLDHDNREVAARKNSGSFNHSGSTVAADPTPWFVAAGENSVTSGGCCAGGNQHQYVNGGSDEDCHGDSATAIDVAEEEKGVKFFAHRHPSAETLPPSSTTSPKPANVEFSEHDTAYVSQAIHASSEPKKCIKDLISHPGDHSLDGLLLTALMVTIKEVSVSARWQYLIDQYEWEGDGLWERSMIHDIYASDDVDNGRKYGVTKDQFERVVIRCDLAYALVRNNFLSWQDAVKVFEQVDDLYVLPNPSLLSSDIVTSWKLCSELLSRVNSWEPGVKFLQKLFSANLQRVRTMLVRARPYLREADIAPYLT